MTTGYKPEVLAALRSRKKETTPDWHELKSTRNEFIPLFVYGSLKKGGRFHQALDGCPTMGSARTSVMWHMRCADDFPLLFRGGKWFTAADTHFVNGEVYLVDIQTLSRIDEIEQNGFLFNRSEHFVFLTDEAQTFGVTAGMNRPSIRCWIYFADIDKFGGPHGLHKMTNITKHKSGRTEYNWDQTNPRINYSTPFVLDDDFQLPSFITGRG